MANRILPLESLEGVDFRLHTWQYEVHIARESVLQESGVSAIHPNAVEDLAHRESVLAL
jgi:hypothetical protein